MGTKPGSITAGDYGITYGAPVNDTDPYPAAADQCASPEGDAACITDGQIQSEIDAVAPANQRGLNNLWFVFLPPNVDECITPGVCGTTAFAAYHSAMNLAHGLTIYGVVIDPLIEVAVPPGQDPQGNPDAEAAIDSVAHETVEAMTDPTGTGWLDSNGFEVADKCEYPTYGSPVGFQNGSPYNQTINGDNYLIQEMWSNDNDGCVQHTSATKSPLPLPQINLTQYSPTVTGNIGANQAGVGVEVLLLRGGAEQLVADETTTTDATGAWSVQLGASESTPGNAVAFGAGDDRDAYLIDYSGPHAPPNDVILSGNGGNPFTESGWTGWYDLDNGYSLSQSGGNAQLMLGPCFQTGVLGLTVGGTAAESPTDFCNTQTDNATEGFSGYTPATVVTMDSNDNRAFFPDQPGLLGKYARRRARRSEGQPRRGRRVLAAVQPRPLPGADGLPGVYRRHRGGRRDVLGPRAGRRLQRDARQQRRSGLDRRTGG